MDFFAQPLGLVRNITESSLHLSTGAIIPDEWPNVLAVGVMQLLPSTAADKSVSIEDITVLENNVHAGAKYMRWLRDTYFNDPDMSKEEQTLFSFAAYNAGPGRVIRLRKEAEEMGMNPDIWFDNVEVVAAKRTGRETVQYVSNIYKYWVAYKLAFDIGRANRIPTIKH